MTADVWALERSSSSSMEGVDDEGEENGVGPIDGLGRREER